MKCPNCNSKEVPEQALLCPSCGTSIQSTSKYRSVESLITKHAELRGKRPGADLGSKEPAPDKGEGEV